MAESAVLAATPRKDHGSGNARRMRRGGNVPGVMYGHKQDAVSVTVTDEDMRSVIRRGQRVVDVDLAGKKQKCLIREVQWDPFGREILHVDFTRVSEDERVRVTVPLVTRGTAAGIAAGGVLNHNLHTVEIECLAIAVPDSIRVNVAELQLDQAIHIKELVLPPGVKVFGDPDTVVCNVAKPLEEVPAPTAAAPVVEGPAEPEVIKRKVAEDKEAAEEKEKK